VSEQSLLDCLIDSFMVELTRVRNMVVDGMICDDDNNLTTFEKFEKS
jgi:hypothetical protein